jgi:hypothetical protein
MICNAAARSLQAAPDLELIALGAELDPIIREWLARRAIDRERFSAFEAECQRIGAIRPDIDAERAAWEEYGEKAKAAHKVPGVKEHLDDDDVWTNIHGRMHPLCDRIMACRARTLAGFMIQVRAASLVHLDAFGDDQDHEEHLAFIKAACAFTGAVSIAEDEAAV